LRADLVFNFCLWSSTIWAFESCSSLSKKFFLSCFLLNVLEIFRSCVKFVAVKRFYWFSWYCLSREFLWRKFICKMISAFNIKMLQTFF